MKISLFFLSLLLLAMVAIEAEGEGDVGGDVAEEYLEEEESSEADAEQEDAALADEDSVTDAMPAESEAEVGAAVAEPFRYKPSRRLQEASNALPEDMKRPIAGGKVKETMKAAVEAAMSSPAAAQGLADLEHEWRLMVAGPEAARVLGTTGKNANRVLTSPEGSEFVNTALATAHVLLSRAGEDTRGDGLGRVLSTAFFLFASPAMPDVVNKAGGLLLNAVSKPHAAVFVRRFWDEVRESLADRRLSEKLNKCGNNVLSLMRTFHNNDRGRQQSPAVKAGGARK